MFIPTATLTSITFTQPPTPQSTKSCNELALAHSGWSASGGVCAAQEIDGNCYNQNNLFWSQASDVCTGVGARLCTLSEIESGVLSGLGCNLATKYVWTDTVVSNTLEIRQQVFDIIWISVLGIPMALQSRTTLLWQTLIPPVRQYVQTKWQTPTMQDAAQMITVLLSRLLLVCFQRNNCIISTNSICQVKQLKPS